MPKRILFLEGNVDGTVGGSYFLMCDLVRNLDRAAYEPVVGFHRHNYLIDELRRDGIEVHLFPQPSPVTFANPLLAALLLPFKKAANFYNGLIAEAISHAKFLKEQRIDMVNANNSITGNHPWMLAAMMTGIPCITHEMGINEHFSFLSRWFGKRLDRIISLSHSIHEHMRKAGVDFPNVEVIHCGIDLGRYHIKERPADLRRKHSIPETAEVIGVVGNIREWKGQETLVRATALLKKDYPNLRCLLVGDCGVRDKAYGDKLHTLCRELDIVENVVFVGFQRNAIDYMELMDVVTHTSIKPEPFGIVTLEAMSRSKPLVSTTIGGPAEVVLSGQTGLLVEPGRPELLAAAVKTFLGDRQHAAENGRLGYQRLLQHFSLQKNIERTMAVYDEVFARRAADGIAPAAASK